MKLKYLGAALGFAVATVAGPWLMYAAANVIGPLVVLVWIGGSFWLLIKPPATKSRSHGDGLSVGPTASGNRFGGIGHWFP
jgi:uncharacterized membrane protein